MNWWIVLPIAVAFIYIFAVAWILPKIFLQNKYKIKTVRDRGIKKYRTANDERGIVYEPDLGTRKYVSQYVLTDDGKEKCLKCKISDKISYIEYDVALFDRNHKVFKVLNVCELIDDIGFTKSVELPQETSYVTIILNKVNNEQMRRPVRAGVSVSKAIIYMLTSLALSFVTAFTFKQGLANSIGGVFRESFMNYAGGHVVTAIATVVLWFIAAVTVSSILVAKNFCINKKVKK
jgi:hypothetical protein